MPCAFSELVDSRSLSKSMEGADHSKDSCIDIIQVSEAQDLTSVRDLNDKGLERLLSETTGSLLRIFFLKVKDATKLFSTRAIDLLQKKAGLSGLLLSQVYQESEWVGRFGNGCFVKQRGETTFEMIYYHCEPELEHTLVNMVATGQSATYFIINPGEGVFDRIRGSLEDNPAHATRLFFPDLLIADELLKSYAEAASAKWEDLADLDTATDGSLPASVLAPKQQDLHLEWLCLSQGLTSTSKQLEFLVQSYSRFFETFRLAADDQHDEMESVSAVLLNINGREEKEKPTTVFEPGVDDLIRFLQSRCHGQTDWVRTSRESLGVLTMMTNARAVMDEVEKEDVDMTGVTVKCEEQTLGLEDPEVLRQGVMPLQRQAQVLVAGVPY